MTRWLTPDHPNYKDTMEYGEGGSVVPGSYGGGGKDEDESSYRPTNPFYDALLAEEIARAQKSRRPGRPQQKRGSGAADGGSYSNLAFEAFKQLDDPASLAAYSQYLAPGVVAGSIGHSAEVQQGLRDALRQSNGGGSGYDGGFSIGGMRKSGPTTRTSSGFGTPGIRFTAKPQQKNEYERRAETGRDRTFERGQKAADLNLELEFEKKRRAEFIKQLKGMIGSAMSKTRLQSGDEQVVNFAGLPVKVPTRGFREESNFDQILSMLK